VEGADALATGGAAGTATGAGELAGAAVVGVED
jgi:hypothetical protein